MLGGYRALEAKEGLSVCMYLLAFVLPERCLAVDITGYVTHSRRDMGIFDQQLDWFQAAAQCKEDGYQGLEVFPRMNSKLSLIVHYLRDQGYPTNSTFWTGLFRPYTHLNKWYESGASVCEEYSKDIIDGDVICSNQCVTVTLDDLYGQITLRAENCSTSFPYICYNNVGPVKYDYFYNYSVTSLPPYANADVHNNVNVSACVDLCTETGQCAGFTHNPTGATCTILHLDQGYGYMTYTVLPGSDHTRHGYKIRSKPTYYPTSTFTTPPDTNYTFPSCNVSEIPPGYCRCNISIQTPKKVDNSVEELIQNLTVNKDETSKSRRKLTSADDDRPSAKAVGVVGLIVLITFAVVLFVFDFNVLMEQAIMCAKLLKKVLNIKKWKTGKED